MECLWGLGSRLQCTVAEHLCASTRSRSDGLLAQLLCTVGGPIRLRRLSMGRGPFGLISDYGHGSWWSFRRRGLWAACCFPRVVGDVPGAHCRRRARRECCQRPRVRVRNCTSTAAAWLPSRPHARRMRRAPRRCPHLPGARQWPVEGSRFAGGPAMAATSQLHTAGSSGRQPGGGHDVWSRWCTYRRAWSVIVLTSSPLAAGCSPSWRG